VTKAVIDWGTVFDDRFLFFIVTADPTQTSFQIQIKHTERLLLPLMKPEIRRQKSVFVLVHKKEKEVKTTYYSLLTHYSL